jgi:hypothetical protein
MGNKMPVRRAAIVGMITLSLLLNLSAGFAGERFTDNGDGTVTDHILRLMWAQTDNQGDVSWQEAERYCRLGPPHLPSKYDNWRMPKLSELESIYAGGEGDQGYEADCGQWVKTIPEIRLSCGWVWASEKKSITARVFNFNRGYHYTDRLVHKRHYRALPVRSLGLGE